MAQGIIPPLVVIVGETASGKSSLAMELAKRFEGEIISADSWAVYTGFTIGTAKPTAQERAEIPHHMIDVADPFAGYSAAEFQRSARLAISDIVRRGKLPILVGGTGLYVDCLVYDYSFLPRSSSALREELNALTLHELQDRANTSGLDTTGIDTHNKRRIIRLIENEGTRPTKSALRDNTLIIGLRVDQELLTERIEKRVDAMLANGLAAEAEQLAAHYGWDVEPMKGIGYREFREYFTGAQTLEQTRARIVASTKGLAKRQRTWFKRNKSIHWVGEQREAVDLLTTFLSKQVVSIDALSGTIES